MQKFIVPPFLKPNDRVLITSPSGKIDKLLLKGLREKLEEWGLRPILGKYAAAKSSSFAGTVKQRLKDLQYGLDHTEIQAIFCSRGGYGAIQLVDHISLDAFKCHPKWVIGYSDITVLHSLLQKEGIASLHAPMARHFTMEPKDNLASELTRQILFGKTQHYIIKAHKLNQRGECFGHIKGGNLAVLQGLRGTSYDINPTNTILFVEDINESPYRIQRMFYNLEMSGILSKLSGLILGQFTETYTNQNISNIVYEAIHPILKKYHFPICYNFPVGHTSRNYPLINGAEVDLKVLKNVVELKFRQK